MEFVWVKGGTYDPEEYNSVTKKREPAPLWINSFLIGKYEVTQGQWKAVMVNNPSYFKDCGDNCPVEQVSWHDVQAFIKKLNSQTGRTYRLPSVNEWEYAMSGGGKKQEYAGTNNVDELGDYAWISENSGYRTHPVGQKKPNKLGIYDMSGNVNEWLQDQYESMNERGEVLIDPLMRRVEGGSWKTITNHIGKNVIFLQPIAATESTQDKFTGFRLVRTPTDDERRALK
jgi:formylglycine-generating enzyme required for sulfatase activity